MEDQSIDPKAFEGSLSGMRGLAESLSKGGGDYSAAERNAGDPMRSGRGSPAAFLMSMARSMPPEVPEGYEEAGTEPGSTAEVARLRADLNALWRSVHMTLIDPEDSIPPEQNTDGVNRWPSNPYFFRQIEDGGSNSTSVFEAIFGHRHNAALYEQDSMHEKVFGSGGLTFDIFRLQQADIEHAAELQRQVGYLSDRIEILRNLIYDLT